MIDILFVHPNASKIIYQDLSKRAAVIEPPIWGYVSKTLFDVINQQKFWIVR